jgi:hypothetical protein
LQIFALARLWKELGKAARRRDGESSIDSGLDPPAAARSVLVQRQPETALSRRRHGFESRMGLKKKRSLQITLFVGFELSALRAEEPSVGLDGCKMNVTA